ncbi:hypothetical protein CBM2599_A160099 [Cupriavidus taiwanensis]|uniref:hypothetical protein n=1 Tax=Cupriavidus taiwanensis TaxID=164546 RepID=UPI000E152DB5|nr:hypothetical protein [Cupriavidus taiwanensis]SOY83436.1 hypothetical protein CBM2599_A160099 [Cupriavidus taiwanensis]SOY84888.1 hypothetical protein CBM2600_A140358 [Cupriavidus taiwanensis]
MPERKSLVEAMRTDDSLHVDIRVLEDIARFVPLEEIAGRLHGLSIPGIPMGDILKFALLNQWFQHHWRSAPITSSGAHIHLLWSGWISQAEEYVDDIRMVLEDMHVRQTILAGVMRVQELLADNGFYVNNGVIFKAATN